MSKQPERFGVVQTEARGLWYEVDGKMVDGVELVIRVPAASRPGELTTLHFLLPSQAALNLSEHLALAAQPKGDPAPHAPPSTLQ